MLCSLILIAIILFQSGRDANISGAISGGANNFYGKNKTATRDLVLKRATVVTSIVFIMIIVIVNVMEMLG
jgi:preprotein translocase subunit SecG